MKILFSRDLKLRALLKAEDYNERIKKFFFGELFKAPPQMPFFFICY